MKYKITNLSEYGVIDDVPDNELPDNAFSAGQNIKFLDGKVIKFKGHQQVFEAPPVAPYWMRPFNNQSSYFWIFAGQTKIYVTDMAGNYFNITRQSGGGDDDYAATLDNNWTGGVLGGSVPILSNGIDPPQSWSGQTSDDCLNLKYDASRTWDDVSYSTRSIRPFKSFLVALDITKGGDRFTNLVKWSSSATPGNVPDTWDESDATKDAGEDLITESSGFLIDSLPLGDNLIIYSEDATHLMQYIGGTFVFRFARLFSGGIISRRCVQPVKQHHLTLSVNDLVLHDGTTPKSIIDSKRRSWLFNNIDPDNYERSFIAPNYRKSEMWVCFPQVGSTLPDMALVWNYKTNSFGIRELPGCPHIAYGVIDPNNSQIIDDQTGIIDLDSSIIDAKGYNPTIYYPLLASTNFYQADTTDQFDGVSMTSYVERTGLTFGSQRNKYISRVTLKMTGTGAITFSLGTQKHPGDSVNWKTYTFTPGTDHKIDTRKTGRYFAYKIESTGNISWDASSIEFEVQEAGDR